MFQEEVYQHKDLTLKRNKQCFNAVRALIVARTGQLSNSVLRLDFAISGKVASVGGCLLAVPSPLCVKSLIGDDYFYCCFARSRGGARLLFLGIVLCA